MMRSEFEKLTGFYPDSALYRCIEEEYMQGDWENKSEFCIAYQHNVDGLAERVQRAADEKLWRTEEEHSKKEIARRSEISALEKKLSRAGEEAAMFQRKLEEAEKRCAMLKEDAQTELMAVLEEIDVLMYAALHDMKGDDYPPDAISYAIDAFDYLRHRLDAKFDLGN